MSEDPTKSSVRSRYYTGIRASYSLFSNLFSNLSNLFLSLDIGLLYNWYRTDPGSSGGLHTVGVRENIDVHHQAVLLMTPQLDAAPTPSSWLHHRFNGGGRTGKFRLQSCTLIFGNNIPVCHVFTLNSV